MVKLLLFCIIFSFTLGGCGQKSTIKNHVTAEKLACAYGDCKHIIRSVTFPLDNSSLAFKTPLPGLGPIAGGILKFVGDIFAKNTKMGRMELSYTQPIPEVPEVLHSVKLKRFFFYMKPKNPHRRGVRDFLSKAWDRITGKGNPTFGFLDKLAVRMTTTELDRPDIYEPKLLEDLLEAHDLSELMKVFKGNYRRQVIDTENARDLVLLKYHKKTKSKDTSEELFGKIHYLETTGDPKELRDFFASEPQFKGHYKKILLLEKSILIELAKDPICDEIFKNVLAENKDHIDNLGVHFIDTCSDDSCLEINVPDVNLLPIAEKGNALRLDAILHADNVPESFKLKGFVEFEVKLDSKI